MKLVTTIELCDCDMTYKGRLLGLINDEEFHAIMIKKRFQNKIFSCRTVLISEIKQNHPKLGGLRLVLAATEVNGKTLNGKHLFITEKLNYVSHADVGDKTIGILGDKDEYYTIKEGTS